MISNKVSVINRNVCQLDQSNNQGLNGYSEKQVQEFIFWSG